MDLELQKALYELFKSNLKFPFYDGLRDEVYPYGAFSYTEDRPLDTKTSKGNFKLLLNNSYNAF